MRDNESPVTASSAALALSVPSPELVTPDLIPPSAPLPPIFPLVIHDTALVLEAGASGEALVHWHLEANDYIGIGLAFAAASGAPAAVLRLRRLRADGGAEVAAEARLHLRSYQGDGDRHFAVGHETAQFEAELGLTNETGGWLLLARSNQLLLGAGAVPPPARETIRPQVTPAHSPSAVLPEVNEIEVATAIAPTQRTAIAVVTSGDPRLDAPPMPLAPVFPLPSTVDHHLFIEINEQRPTASGIHAEPSASANPQLPLREPLPLQIPTQIYGRASARHPDLVIEAELRIHGWGAPNSDIDLFGQRYRIGAGGRFQLLLRVDDATLLAEALCQHPPPELTRTRP